ncbi:MAG: RAD55 family ATPase [Candidatus Dormibacteraceae bacterium]
MVGGLSFLYHNIVLLRYIEQQSEVGRAVEIVKMRNSDHDKGLWTFAITARGFELQSKLVGVSGLLGWSALTAGPNPQGIPSRRLGDAPGS